jgi:hypothetical protein
MNDRDAFAAAALTGLLAAPTDKDRSMDYWARLAYEAADAMLAARGPVAETPEPQHVAGTCRGERHDAAAGVTLTDAERGAVHVCRGLTHAQLRSAREGGDEETIAAWERRLAAIDALLARLGGGT